MANRKGNVDIKVECYAGYRGEETPRRIWLGNKKIAVKEVQDRWLAPNHRYFKVLGENEAVYLLRHHSITWNWELVFFENN
jgi:hypothetical protein